MSTVQESSSRLFWLIVLSAVFPPLAVALEFGVFRWDLLWNVLLTILLPFGGFVHAAYLLTKARYNSPASRGYEQVTNDAEVSVPQHEHAHEHHHPPQQRNLPPSTSSAPHCDHVQVSEPSVELPIQTAPPPYTPELSRLDNKIQTQR